MRPRRTHTFSPGSTRETACGLSLFPPSAGIMERIQTVQVVDSSPSCRRCQVSKPNNQGSIDGRLIDQAGEVG